MDLRLDGLMCANLFGQIEVDSKADWWIADRQHPYSLAAEQAVYDEWKAG